MATQEAKSYLLILRTHCILFMGNKRTLKSFMIMTMIIVCQSLGSRPILVLELFTLVLRLFGTTSCCLSVQPVQLLPSRRSEDSSLWFGLSPMDTVTPHGLLMLRNCFLDFAVEHWFGCRSTEPGIAGDLGAIEVWLIDWLIDWFTRPVPTDPWQIEIDRLCRKDLQTVPGVCSCTQYWYYIFTWFQQSGIYLTSIL